MTEFDNQTESTRTSLKENWNAQLERWKIKLSDNKETTLVLFADKLSALFNRLKQNQNREVLLDIAALPKDFPEEEGNDEPKDQTPIQEQKEQPLNTTDHLPSIADIPETFIAVVNRRSSKLKGSLEKLTTLEEQLKTQRENTTIVSGQISEVLSEEPDNNKIRSKVDSFLVTLNQEVKVLAAATEKLLAGKDASKILGMDSSRFREIRSPRNLGDLIARFTQRDRSKITERRNSFGYEQWYEIDRLSNKIISQEIKKKITDMSQLTFPKLEISMIDELARQQITTELPQFIASLRTLEEDLSFLESLQVSLSQQKLPEVFNKYGTQIEIQKELLDRINREIEERQRALSYIQSSNSKRTELTQEQQQAFWGVRDLIRNAASSCTDDSLRSSDSGMGSGEVLSKLSELSTVTGEQFTVLQQIREKALSLDNFLPGIIDLLGGIDTTIQRIEYLAEVNHNLPTSEGIVTHGVSLDTFRSIFESHMLGSRAYVLEQTGKAKYTTAALEVEKQGDGTYVLQNTWAKMTKKIGSFEELKKETGLDNKRWSDEYYQLCFSVDRTYHKMNGAGIYFAFNRGRMLTKYQFADDDGLHMFDPEYSSENQQPFTLNLSEEPYRILVPKKEAAAFTQMILEMPEALFDKYGGKTKWLEEYVSVHDSINDDIDEIRQKFKEVTEMEAQSERKGVVVPSGVIEENLIIRHKAPLLKYKSKSS